MDTEEPRIKMYTDDQGKFKGEALIIYYRPESVPLAVEMLDDTAFDFKQGPNGNMRVQVADRSFKKQKDTDVGAPQDNQPKKYRPDKKKLEAGKKKMQQYALKALMERLDC